MSQKKVMSVVWQEWQVRGIITETWKVCVSTFGHLRRIDPHCAAAGLMSTDSPASNERRAIATVFHQPSAPSVHHPIMPEHAAWAAEQRGYLVTHQCEGFAKMSPSQVWSWKHCDWLPLGWLDAYPHLYSGSKLMWKHKTRHFSVKAGNISTACPLRGRSFPAGETCLDYVDWSSHYSGSQSNILWIPGISNSTYFLVLFSASLQFVCVMLYGCQQGAVAWFTCTLPAAYSSPSARIFIRLKKKIHRFAAFTVNSTGNEQQN